MSLNRVAFCLLVVLALLTGCGRPPAVEQSNLPLIVSLRTALSARNAEWLQGVERAVGERRAARQMSEVTAEHFEQLIQSARDGHWEAAERACLDFEKAQVNRQR